MPPDASTMSSNRIHTFVRVLAWVSFVMAPIAFTLAIMDYGAHNGGPGIGLEGAGRPGSSSTPLMMIALVGIVGGLVAWLMLPPPRGSLVKVAAVCVVCFIASMIASRPIFHWKWRVDCDHDVALACWTLARMAPPHDESGSALGRKACDLGEPAACKQLAEGSVDDKARACAERKKACGKSAWPEATCKDLENACGPL